MTAGKSIKWAPKLSHVREVSLLGSADLSFWTDMLKRQGLAPRPQNGRAEVRILGASAKFMTMRFREISISIQVCRPPATADQDEVFLVSAFNSNRFFAFSERVFFSTPYSHANVQVDSNLATLRIAAKNTIALLAQFSNIPGRTPAQQTDENWQGPVHLPSTICARENTGFFFARLAGRTERFGYVPSRDTITIKPLAPNDALSALLESNFTPHEWVLRTDATHAKSKTYRRSDPILAPQVM